MEKLKFRKVRKRVIEIYIPEIDKWVNSIKACNYLKKIGLTPKEWYDKHFLPRDESGNIIYPTCEWSKCNNLTEFIGILYGYRKSCCKDHHNKHIAECETSYCHSEENKQWRSEWMKCQMKDKDSSINKGRNTESYRAKQSELAKIKNDNPNNMFGLKSQYSNPNSKVNSEEHILLKTERIMNCKYSSPYGSRISFLSSKMGSVMKLKSTFEMIYAEFLDSSEDIESFEYENFIKGGVPYEYKGKKRRYYPDFKVNSIYDTVTIVEVKPEHLIDSEEVQVKMKALNEYINKNNLDWSTAWISEKDLNAIKSGKLFYKTLQGKIIYV